MTDLVIIVLVSCKSNFFLYKQTKYNIVGFETDNNKSVGEKIVNYNNNFVTII